jgi:hypothetical protein
MGVDFSPLLVLGKVGRGLELLVDEVAPLSVEAVAVVDEGEAGSSLI